MKPRIVTLSVFTLGAALTFGAVAIAGDLPKEGTLSLTYASAGTLKANPIGKEALAGSWDENGLSVGSGLLDHATWHCFGLYDIAKGMADWRGYCTMTDGAGDQVRAVVLSDGKYPADAKMYKGQGLFTTGTGKYAGINGGFNIECHSPEFRTAADGTYVQYAKMQGSYKLP
jgi:hypothetical protein